MQESDSTLIEPSSVTVIEIASDVQQASSTPAKVTKKCENSVESDKSTSTRKAGTPGSKGSVKKSPAKSSKLTTGNKLEQLDQKWSERFNKLEAMLLSKTFNQPEPVFHSVVGPTAKPPPASAGDNNQQPVSEQPTNHQSTGTNQLTGHCSSAAPKTVNSGFDPSTSPVQV